MGMEGRGVGKGERGKAGSGETIKETDLSTDRSFNSIIFKNMSGRQF